MIRIQSGEGQGHCKTSTLLPCIAGILFYFCIHHVSKQQQFDPVLSCSCWLIKLQYLIVINVQELIDDGPGSPLHLLLRHGCSLRGLHRLSFHYQHKSMGVRKDCRGGLGALLVLVQDPVQDRNPQRSRGWLKRAAVAHHTPALGCVRPPLCPPSRWVSGAPGHLLALCGPRRGSDYPAAPWCFLPG